MVNICSTHNIHSAQYTTETAHKHKHYANYTYQYHKLLVFHHQDSRIQRYRCYMCHYPALNKSQMSTGQVRLYNHSIIQWICVQRSTRRHRASNNVNHQGSNSNLRPTSLDTLVWYLTPVIQVDCLACLQSHQNFQRSFWHIHSMTKNKFYLGQACVSLCVSHTSIYKYGMNDKSMYDSDNQSMATICSILKSD